jgi:3-oxoacyl-[acyl-carrier protein] reductase
VGTLDGRLALVTGAGRGFGRAIALALGDEGADVVVNYRRSAAEAEKVVEELRAVGRRALAHRADVAIEEEVRGLVAATLTEFGQLDVLVNNAGVMVRGPLLERLESVEDVAYSVVVLATAEAGYLTGQTLHPSGGWVMW